MKGVFVMKKAGVWAVLLPMVAAGCATSHLGYSSGRPEVLIPSSNRHVIKTALVEVFVSKDYVLTSETEGALAFVGKMNMGSGNLNKIPLESPSSSHPDQEIIILLRSAGKKTRVYANAFPSMQNAFGRTERGDITSGEARKQLQSFLDKAKRAVKSDRPTQSFKQPHEYVTKPDKIGIQIGNQKAASIAPSEPADLAGLQVGDKIATADSNAPYTVKGGQPIRSFEKPHEYMAKPGKIGIQIGNQIVAGITPSGPADLAGLQVGDKIITANGNALNGDNRHDVALIVGDPGTIVLLKILRGDQELEIPVTRGGQPIQSFERLDENVAKPGKIGIQIGNQIVAGIAPSGPADLAGLQVGDKIIAADGNALNGDNLHDVALIIGDPGTSVLLKVLRGDQELEIPVARGL